MKKQPHQRHLVRALVGIVLPRLFGMGVVVEGASCSLCGDQPIPKEGLFRSRHGVRCRDLYDQTMILANDDVTADDDDNEGWEEECQSIQLTAFQTGCCHEQYVPDNVCSVCPDGSPYYHSSISIPGALGRKELTCADLATEASFLDFMTTPGDCGDTFLQRSAAWCRCPGQHVECHLCPNGAAPIDPQKTEHVVYGWSCENFQYVAALLNQGECALNDQVLEFDARAFCCEGVDPPNVCQLCPTGQELIHPDKTIATPFGFGKCSDIDESLRMMPTEASCDFTKQSFSTEQCCGYTGKHYEDDRTTMTFLARERTADDRSAATFLARAFSCGLALLTGVYSLF